MGKLIYSSAVNILFSIDEVHEPILVLVFFINVSEGLVLLEHVLPAGKQHETLFPLQLEFAPHDGHRFSYCKVLRHQKSTKISTFELLLTLGSKL